LIANLAVGALGLFNSARFGGLADASRLLAVVSSGIFVWALVAEFARLLTRASSLDRFMTMARYASNVVYLLDSSGACIYMNQRWEETTGQPMEEALGTGFTNLVHPDDLARTQPERAAGIASGERYEYELRYRCADGSYRWHLVSNTPTFDSAGQLDGWYAVSTDIDAQHRAHDQLAELYAREHRIAQTLQSAFIPRFCRKSPGCASRPSTGRRCASLNWAATGTTLSCCPTAESYFRLGTSPGTVWTPRSRWCACARRCARSPASTIPIRV
jgi:PAS domain S-box-containing protein